MAHTSSISTAPINGNMFGADDRGTVQQQGGGSFGAFQHENGRDEERTGLSTSFRKQGSSSSRMNGVQGVLGGGRESFKGGWGVLEEEGARESVKQKQPFMPKQNRVAPVAL